MKKKNLSRLTVVKPTAQDKGLALNMHIVAYDNGQVYIDGTPMMGESTDVETWLSTASVAVQKINELQRRFCERKRKLNDQLMTKR